LACLKTQQQPTGVCTNYGGKFFEFFKFFFFFLFIFVYLAFIFLF
jgi:hypothetical protein